MTVPDQPVHGASCRWEKTTLADCEYRATHHYCPHPEHECSCLPRAVPAPGGHPLDVLAIAACEAFRLATGDRLAMPPWKDVPPHDREDWRMVADAVQMAAAPPIRAQPVPDAVLGDIAAIVNVIRACGCKPCSGCGDCRSRLRRIAAIAVGAERERIEAAIIDLRARIRAYAESFAEAGDVRLAGFAGQEDALAAVLAIVRGETEGPRHDHA